MENIIEIKNLYKSFKNIKAVQNLSFKVKPGELFAFLGLNGAGKSTTISIMCGELEKDSGEVYINGVNIETGLDTIKDSLGIVFQNSALDKFLSVKDNLRYRSVLYDMDNDAFELRLKELDELLGIEYLLGRVYGKLSGGEKRRIDISRALLNNPNILILDEPTTGLDPQTRKVVWTAMNKLRKEKGMTIFLTTHYMEETIDADYVVILDKGKIVGEGTPLELKNKYTGDFITIYNSKIEDVKKLGYPYKKLKNAYRIEIPDTMSATNLICKYPNIFVDYEIVKGNMDDVFLNVTGKILGGNE